MNNRFIARQLIFDRRLKIFGYELLFRAGPESIVSAPASPSLTTSSSIPPCLLTCRLSSATPWPSSTWTKPPSAAKSPSSFPPKVVLEILESVRPFSPAPRHLQRSRRRSVRPCSRRFRRRAQGGAAHPLHPAPKSGLLRRYSDALKITKAYEAGDWPSLSTIASKIGYAESEVPEWFLSAASKAPGPLRLTKNKTARSRFPGGSLLLSWSSGFTPLLLCPGVTRNRPSS